MKSNINTADIMALVFASMMVSSVGLFLTKITVALSGPVLNSRSTRALVCAAIFIFCITLSTHLISTITELLSGRLNTKTSVAVESAMIMRIIALPVSFHRNYSPGELKSRSMAVNELCKLLQDIFVTTGFTAIASLLYVTQIFRYAPGLVVPSFIIILITVGVSLITTLLQIRVSKIIRENTAKEEGMSYSLITGIQKIKLAGAEKRAFARWLNIYSDKAALQYNPPTLLKVSNVINTAISLFSTIIIYYIAVITGVNQSEYLGFTVAYGYLMGAFNSFSNLAISMAQIDPILKMAEPFLKTVPEVSEDREIVTNISGNVEIAHVSFRYSDKTPFVLKDLSLKINAGDYVAIVGKTGCGKSTLLRMIAGLEDISSGEIYIGERKVNDVPPKDRDIAFVFQ